MKVFVPVGLVLKVLQFVVLMESSTVVMVVPLMEMETATCAAITVRLVAVLQPIGTIDGPAKTVPQVDPVYAVTFAPVGGILLQVQARLLSLHEGTPLTVVNDNVPALVHDGFEVPQQAVPQDVVSVQV